MSLYSKLAQTNAENMTLISFYNTPSHEPPFQASSDQCREYDINLFFIILPLMSLHFKLAQTNAENMTLISFYNIPSHEPPFQASSDQCREYDINLFL